MARTPQKKPAEVIAEDLASPSAVNQDDGEKLTLIVGGNVKRLRLRRNPSLEGLARLGGVSRAMVGLTEPGRSVPRINMVGKAANALDVRFPPLVTSRGVEPYR